MGKCVVVVCQLSLLASICKSVVFLKYLLSQKMKEVFLTSEPHISCEMEFMC